MYRSVAASICCQGSEPWATLDDDTTTTTNHHGPQTTVISAARARCFYRTSRPSIFNAAARSAGIKLGKRKQWRPVSHTFAQKMREQCNGMKADPTDKIMAENIAWEALGTLSYVCALLSRLGRKTQVRFFKISFILDLIL